MSELRALAAASGLAGRAADVERLARTSVRLEPADASTPPSWTQVGGRPALRDDADWPRRNERKLRFLAQIAIGELPVVPTGWPERDELVLLFVDDEDRAVTALRAPRPRPRWPRRGPPRRSGIAVALAPESVLPRAWAAPVQALALDQPERESWQALRSAWAVEQAAELEDEADKARVVHRLGGYPDERRGLMPALCELRAAGIDGYEGDPHRAVAAAGLPDRLPRWRLLAQLSSDPALGWDWGSERARLYVWVDAEDLASGHLASVTAFAQ